MIRKINNELLWYLNEDKYYIVKTQEGRLSL